MMFCDLADSTELSTKLDPEDLQDIIRAYQDRSTELIQEYEGYVAKYMGDGILVYFGYPKSLERNAERAVRSGLSIIESMADLNHTLGREKGIEIAVRIGISTGMVIVGEVVGEGLAQERTVIGEAPNVAARLQGLASRNGIVVGTLTRELAGDAFEYEDLGGQDLKGIDGKVSAWGVIGLKGETADEVDIAGEADLAEAAPLVGRDEEIGLLRRAWQSTKDESLGQIVSISGEAGIGKSVLTDGLANQARAEGLPRVTFRCSPYHTGSALYPAIEHFKRLARWQPNDPVEARLTKLEAVLKRYNQPLAETVPLLGELMSLPLPEDRYPPLGLSPQQQKHQTQDTIIAMTMEEAERQPHLQIWEDLHWADPSTLELLGLLIDQAPTASLLIVLTARPEFVPPWPGRSHNTPITLNRLERPHTEGLIARIAEKSLPREVIDHIVAKTDGVPLYVEELTKTILASDILRDAGDRFELTGPLASLSIPETLQESLMARLDRMPQVREIAQIGSVLGREFAYEMISGLSVIEEDTLEDRLRELVDAELLYQRGRPPRAKYIFKHALVQDAAYESLLKRKRQRHHHEVADLIVSRFPDIADSEPEVLAHHFSEGGNVEQAASYWLAAGQRAVERSANVEAVAHLTRGLELISETPDTPGRTLQELDFLKTLGPALIATKGFGASEVVSTYQRAESLADQIGDQRLTFTIMRGQWNYYLFSALLVEGRDRGEELQRIAQQSKDPGFALEAYRVLCTISFFVGDFPSARSYSEQGLALYDPEKHHELALVFGADPGVVCNLYGGLALWLLGFSEQAQRKLDAALALTKQRSHSHTEAFALSYLAIHHQFRHDVPATQEWAQSAIGIASKLGIRQWLSWSTILGGWANALAGDWEEGLDQLDVGLSKWQSPYPEFMSPLFLALKAEVLTKGMRVEDALEALNEAEALVEKNAERLFEAEIHRLRGEALLIRSENKGNSAETCFQKALEVARRQSAKSLEIRAAIALARLWGDQRKYAEAHQLLADVYGWFNEGLDTPDLIEARQLLQNLSEHRVA